MKRHRPSAEEGNLALLDHAAAVAERAAAQYGPSIDHEAMLRLLADRQIVRYPVEIAFDTQTLEPGEFAYAAPVSDDPKAGYRLSIHASFEGRPEVLPLLVAYHLPVVNYGDIVNDEVALRFGARLLGLDEQIYHDRLCELADSLPPA